MNPLTSIWNSTPDYKQIVKSLYNDIIWSDIYYVTISKCYNSEYIMKIDFMRKKTIIIKDDCYDEV